MIGKNELPPSKYKPNYKPVAQPPKGGCSGLKCNHKLVHLETKKYETSCGFNSEWKRIDIYHCERCGELITKEEKTYNRDRPDWY
ncbi:hypothetical protein [Tepidibacter mesophilus]|uniref:hypothetical protein n=1 Tax=Tepidibacter mesophilus TaxID=655607 RepID=UPI000C06D9FF|nr:hypothetical protein [Tepidibacter mesophilus]